MGFTYKTYRETLYCIDFPTISINFIRICGDFPVSFKVITCIAYLLFFIQYLLVYISEKLWGFQTMCNPHPNYMWHGDSLHFLWEKHLQCKSFSRMKIPLSLKMSLDLSGRTISNIALIFGAILGIVSSITCFGFIFKKLKINHVIRKLLLFATLQQSLGYGIFFGSILAIGFGIQNKVTCFFGVTSILTSTCGSRASISMISVIR